MNAVFFPPLLFLLLSIWDRGHYREGMGLLNVTNWTCQELGVSSEGKQSMQIQYSKK